MLQFPAFMTQYPSSSKTIPTSFLLPSQSNQPPHNEDLLLAMEESHFEEKQLVALHLLAGREFKRIAEFLWRQWLERNRLVYSGKKFGEELFEISRFHTSIRFSLSSSFPNYSSVINSNWATLS